MGIVQETDHSEDVGWGAPDVVDHFETVGHSDRGEAAALVALGAWVRGEVLDVGIGGGRTTGLLAPSARTYVGLDVAQPMLDLARSSYPDADLRLGDASDLAGLPARHFDLVMFSFNGLDALDRTDRAGCLAAMARVVAPGGRVLFSSLNLDGVSYDERPWWVAGGLRSARVRYHLLDALRHPSIVARSLRNFRRTRTEGEDGPGWSRRPMRAHEFRFVVHFATLGTVVDEIRAAGLEVVAAYADDGTPVDATRAHTSADYVHFVCRRA